MGRNATAKHEATAKHDTTAKHDATAKHEAIRLSIYESMMASEIAKLAMHETTAIDAKPRSGLTPSQQLAYQSGLF